MKKRLHLRNSLAVVILALASALALFIVSNLRGNAPDEVLESLPKNVDLSLKKIDYTETRDGQPTWTLTADSAAHNLKEGVARIENVRMTFFDEGLGNLSLQADHGELATEKREVTAMGNVVIRSPQGYSFYTDRLDYYERDRTIRTDQAVRLVSSTGTISGRGMRLNVANRTVTLLAEVRADFPHGFRREKP
jgi:lipopolysaccharide export system protein LptC